MKAARLLALCTACASSAPPAPPAQPSPPRDLAAEAAEAEGRFRDLEDRLLRAKRIEIMARIEATGAIRAGFVGRLLIYGAGDGRVHMDFDGTFEGESQELLLISDGQGMGLNETGPHDAPPGLVGALVVGFTRMGLAHNVVRGVHDLPPDHSDGDPLAWLSVDSFSAGEVESLRGRKARPVSYRVLVDGQPAADATLWLDVDSGLPLQRRMVVHFPQGDMRVVESYGRLIVEN